ncbi:tRNA (adenosine(37)-N6)-threonylcarbamoyltransferase complex dimerization subunit type 1 TsaB [Novosphingobium sp. 1949]|uniref:tRNA (Adenosine(37)-N6)-threonylcarbamoyltransferase complex dimerization subunit type 1 TsaB n=1 Tax=Novosphingobium organovorum TaxID=2930092 RepID=A0ABT0BBA6_9SPHN|nr:tRNA (adenosine(37)-N6)-threonylcarbamoyltransferase complex dimerization subunit type 1 TsaB [Novosphingobium organovorum]MCJ2182344.1 tRNA (adenosine(37)-N6)-threonylcarbamoyltransferase complex dimerization subunit type 1 TsaB [Novosphingobium organovorum]
MPANDFTRTLVIDSATSACSVALFEGTTLIEGAWRNLGRGHAEALVPMIAALPDRGRAGRIAVALGPGSFTGVRVGLAAARALALAWGSAIVGYPSLALIAAMARAQDGDGPLDVAMTGGHGEWFVESFDAAGHTLQPLASLPPEAAASRLRAERVAGNQAEALVARRKFGTPLNLLPDARAFAALPDNCLTADISPLYGRAPDARPASPAPPPSRPPAAMPAPT